MVMSALLGVLTIDKTWQHPQQKMSNSSIAGTKTTWTSRSSLDVKCIFIKTKTYTKCEQVWYVCLANVCWAFYKIFSSWTKVLSYKMRMELCYCQFRNVLFIISKLQHLNFSFLSLLYYSQHDLTNRCKTKSNYLSPKRWFSNQTRLK